MESGGKTVTLQVRIEPSLKRRLAKEVLSRGFRGESDCARFMLDLGLRFAEISANVFKHRKVFKKKKMLGAQSEGYKQTMEFFLQLRDDPPNGRRTSDYIDGVLKAVGEIRDLVPDVMPRYKRTLEEKAEYLRQIKDL